MPKIALTPHTILGFTENFLLPDYDNAHPIEKFHIDWWNWCCDSYAWCALAAPRGHSKSTNVNHAFGLAAALFEAHPFQLKISKTRGIAIEYIQSAKNVLLKNAKVQKQFGFKRFTKETEDDFIAEFSSGYQCRMMAFGSEQAIRGASWDTRRPSLVICDDMEDDEQVLNAERRQKLWNWFMNAVLPIGTPQTLFRVVGTILHVDSLLQRLLNDETWRSLRYEGTNDDLSWFLWPDMYAKEWWQVKKQQYVKADNLIGFNMEYRNIAVDATSGFFQPGDFIDMDESDFNKPHRFYVGGDLAISKKKRRDKTCFVVGGLDPENFLDLIDVRRGRWDGAQIIDEMFAIEETYRAMQDGTPLTWYVEKGHISLALQSALEQEMRKRQIFLDIRDMVPVSDKPTRARPLQIRMRKRGVRINKSATWYQDFYNEFLQFRGGDEPNDQVDATAWMAFGLKDAAEATSLEDRDEEVYLRESREHVDDGRSLVTGY